MRVSRDHYIATVNRNSRLDCQLLPYFFLFLYRDDIVLHEPRRYYLLLWILRNQGTNHPLSSLPHPPNIIIHTSHQPRLNISPTNKEANFPPRKMKRLVKRLVGFWRLWVLGLDCKSPPLSYIEPR